MSGANVHGLDDMSPVRAMLQIVPIEHVLIGLKRSVDRRIEPRAAPIDTWRDERFLRAVARTYALNVLVPSMIAAWEAAGKAPQKPADAPAPSPAVPSTLRPGKRTSSIPATARRQS
jgi:hypothetical protein